MTVDGGTLSDSLQTLFGKDVGLYRDDGLAVLNTKSGRLGDKARQDLTRAFNDLGLNITTLTNQVQTSWTSPLTLLTTPTNPTENLTTSHYTSTTLQPPTSNLTRTAKINKQTNQHIILRQTNIRPISTDVQRRLIKKQF